MARQPNEFFDGISPTDFLAICSKPRLPEKRHSAIFTHLASAQAFALDIESDGETLYQIGWASGKESQLVEDLLEDDATQKAVEQLAKAASGKTLVGHNIHAWDIPVLRRHCPNAFDGNPTWDTLLMSWMLEPWADTHALTTSACAHRANADAKASLDLYCSQMARFPASFLDELDQNGRAPLRMLAFLTQSLHEIEGRNYPAVPDFLPKSAFGPECAIVLVPEWRLSTCAWCPGIRYGWPATFREETWRVISPDGVRAVANTNPDNVWLSAIAVVVLDAEANGVQVTLSMLPMWLREQTEQFLSKCLLPVGDMPPSGQEETCCVSSYRSWRNAPAEKTRAVFRAASTVKLFAHEAELEWLLDPKPLKTIEVQDAIEVDSVGIEAETLLALNDPKAIASLTHLADMESYRHWLLFNPADKQAGTPSFWSFLSRQLDPSPSAYADSEFPSDGNTSFDAAFPVWWTPGNAPSPLLRDFVPPSSGNRLAYWQDAISRLLSIAKAEDSTLVLLLQNDCEMAAVREALAAIEQTTIVAGSILRQLEAVQRGKCRIAADVIVNAHQWLVAAEKLQCEVQLVVESLPLHLWWMCLDQSEMLDGEHCETFTVAEDEGATGEEDGAEADTEQDVDVHADDAVPRADAPRKKRYRPVTLSRDGVELCIHRFLNPWLASMLRMEAPARPPHYSGFSPRCYALGSSGTGTSARCRVLRPQRKRKRPPALRPPG